MDTLLRIVRPIKQKRLFYRIKSCADYCITKKHCFHNHLTKNNVRPLCRYKCLSLNMELWARVYIRAFTVRAWRLNIFRTGVLRHLMLARMIPENGSFTFLKYMLVWWKSQTFRYSIYTICIY